jgi:hypothetical protein
MKSSSLALLHLAFLVAIMSCGKNNESGKKTNSWGYNNPYVNGQVPLSNINSPYQYGGIRVNSVLAENPCRNGYGGYPNNNQGYSGQRIPIQIPMLNFPTVIPPNDLYVGVTSYGDVAVLVGGAIGTPPLFVGYMCPRSFSPSGQGQLMGVKLGTYSKCLLKPMTEATIIFPSGGGTANFRWLDGGNSLGTRFSFCGGL